MNNLQIFKNKEFGQIRTVTIDNEPWFVGKDYLKLKRNQLQTQMEA